MNHNFSELQDRDDLSDVMSLIASELPEMQTNTIEESFDFHNDSIDDPFVTETSFTTSLTEDTPDEILDARFRSSRTGFSSGQRDMQEYTLLPQDTSALLDSFVQEPTVAHGNGRDVANTADSDHLDENTDTPQNVQYTDTNVDLERSLEFYELLEHDDVSADAFNSYMSDRFEDKKVITFRDTMDGQVDMQGIRWKSGMFARREYRHYRLNTYENYFNSSSGPFKGITSPVVHDRPDRAFLKFVQMQTEHKCSLVHFQLRNLLSAVDRHSVYYTGLSAVKTYHPQAHTSETIMDLSKVATSYPFKISSLAATAEYCCVGGFFGEYALKHTAGQYNCGDAQAGINVGLVTTDVTGITNHIAPQLTRSGTSRMTISSNDSCLRHMDVSTLKVTNEIVMDHPLNCSAISTDRRLQVVVGDECAALLLDAESGEILKKIDGHTDYSFACAWSNDGYTFATGSQDLTTRIYDARGNMDIPLAVFKASIGAVRSLKFSDCGRLLAVAEPADFVHIHDIQDLGKAQSIDFFGEISGIDFAGDDSFFIGNADRTIGGIMEFERRNDSLGLEDLLL